MVTLMVLVYPNIYCFTTSHYIKSGVFFPDW